MDCNCIIGIGGLIVGGLGVVVSIVSVCFAKKVRKDVFTASLFSKQLDSYSEIMNSLNEFYIACEDYLAGRPKNSLGTDGMRQIFWQGVRESFYNFKLKYQKVGLFLPDRFHQVLKIFMNTFHAISLPLERINNRPDLLAISNADNHLNKLKESYVAVIKEVENHLAVDKLQEEYFKLLGEFSLEPD